MRTRRAAKSAEQISCKKPAFAYIAATVRFEAERNREGVPRKRLARGDKKPMFPCLSSA